MLLNSLGRVLVASGLVAVTSFMASTAAFAKPTASNDFTIAGIVAPTISILVGPPVDLGTILTAGTLPATRVADVTYKTNGNGLTITVAGNLKLVDYYDTASTIPFQIGIDGTGGKGYQGDYSGEPTANVLLDTGNVHLDDTTSGLWIRSNLAHVIPGTYKANLTLTATDK